MGAQLGNYRRSDETHSRILTDALWVGGQTLKGDKAMYRVWYTFENECGEWVRTYLDNNGKGFDNDEAVSLARELEARGHGFVRVWKIGSEADRAEREGR